MDVFDGGECLLGTNACFGCVKTGPMVRDFCQLMNQAKEDAELHPNANDTDEPPKRNWFYVLKGREEKEKSFGIVMGMLHVFTFPVNAWLDPWSTLSFDTPLIASRFDVLL